MGGKNRVTTQRILALLFNIFLLWAMMLNSNTYSIRAENPTKTPTNSSSYTLRDLFSGKQCKVVCWQGIEPGLTTIGELKEHWDSHKSTPYINSVDPTPSADNAVIDWQTDDYIFAPSNLQARRISVTTWKGTIIQMIVPVEICPSQIVREFGTPFKIGKFETNFYLMYPQKGLIFLVGPNYNSYRVVPVFLVSQMDMGNWLEYPELSFQNWSDVAKYIESGCLSDGTF